MSKITSSAPGLRAQKAYLEELHARGFNFGLTVGAAFVRGIRDIGYKHTGTALAELIDNSQQAGAENVHVAFSFEGKSAKPAAIAVIDDGHGMEPDMMRLAATWGGTHREGDRKGMGRFGYGLPSACVSQGRRYTIYSKPPGGELHAVTIDLDQIAEGRYNDAAGEIIIPAPTPCKLPRFAADHIERHFPDGGFWAHGTAIVIEKLDRTTWRTLGALRENLLQHFGVTYHKLRREMDIWVHDVSVDPIDPLFTTPGFRFHELDGDPDRAEALDPLRIEVRDPDTRAVIGELNVRFAYMPPTFGSIDKNRKADRGNANPRFAIMKAYNGIIFSRMGRLIDVVTSAPWATFLNNDRYLKIEVDFSASLDELFNVPTSKQRVDVSDRVWDILKQNGVPKALEQLRQKFREAKARQAALLDERTHAGKRASEEAMEKTGEVSRPPSEEIAARRDQRGAENLLREARRRAFERDLSVDQAQQQLELELGNKPYKVDTESLPGAPWFRVRQIGGSKVLSLNTSHRFFTDLYGGSMSSPSLRAALEVMLFSIGDCMLDAPESTQSFYRLEVPQWSGKLDYALEQLSLSVTASSDDDDERDAPALLSAAE
jgi:hypothetical protein